MTSDKKLQTKKGNARKSTGPRTQAGKAQPRFNSRKHGLTAKTLIVVGEEGQKQMTSQKQLEANRANAKRSTGPRTSDGKARSRMNAVKHGLTAKYIVIGDEDPDEFEALRADLEADFQPSTRLEHELIDRLAGLLWRLRRVPGVEAALVKARQVEAWQNSEHVAWLKYEARHRCNKSFGSDDAALDAIMDGTYDARLRKFLEEVQAEESEQEVADSDRERETWLLMLIRDVENDDALGKLTRYEAGLMNAVTRTLQHLHLLQAKRNATKVISV